MAIRIATTVLAITLVGSMTSAVAQPWLSISEYYEHARPLDMNVPGLRVQDFGYAGVRTPGASFPIEQIAAKYAQDPEFRVKLRRATANISGLFELLENRGLQGRYLGIRGTPPFLEFNLSTERKIYVVPIDDETKSELIRVLREYRATEY